MAIKIDGKYAKLKINKKFGNCKYVSNKNNIKSIISKVFQYCRYLIIHEFLLGRFKCLEIRNHA